MLPRWVYKDLAAAGIPKVTAEGKIDFHALRTAYTTFVFEAGASVKEAQSLARHSTPDLTLNVYARSRSVRLTEIATAVGDRFLPADRCTTGVQQNVNASATPPVTSCQIGQQYDSNDLSGEQCRCGKGFESRFHGKCRHRQSRTEPVSNRSNSSAVRTLRSSWTFAAGRIPDGAGNGGGRIRTAGMYNRCPTARGDPQDHRRLRRLRILDRAITQKRQRLFRCQHAFGVMR